MIVVSIGAGATVSMRPNWIGAIGCCLTISVSIVSTGTIGPTEPCTTGSAGKGIVVSGSRVYSSGADASINGKIARSMASRAVAEASELLA